MKGTIIKTNNSKISFLFSTAFTHAITDILQNSLDSITEEVKKELSGAELSFYYHNKIYNEDLKKYYHSFIDNTALEMGKIIEDAHNNMREKLIKELELQKCFIN